MILIAGLGNVFHGDDGFGVEVAQRLRANRPSSWPDWIEVGDYGVGGLHLAYDLLADYDLVVFIDALPRGAPPGTVTLFEPTLPEPGEIAPPVNAHAMDPMTVLVTLEQLGGSVERVVIVGCEPLDVGERMGLSEHVTAAVNVAAEMVEEVVAREMAARHVEVN